jgi:hypothetical protein
MKIGKHDFTKISPTRLVTFGEWLHHRELNEVGTSTGDVAMFVRPIFSEPFHRPGLPQLGDDGDVTNYDDPKRYKKKRK